MTPAAPGGPAAVPDRPVARSAPRPTPLSTPAVVLPAARIQELTEPTQPVRGTIGRPRPPPPPREMEDVLADVFDRVQGVYQYRDAASGLYYLLDLALEKIPAESGSAFSAELITGTLRFVAVRGPKAKEILESRAVIPAGQGIAGFCTAEGVSLALSDVHRDPRWYSAIADRVQYDTRSLSVLAHGVLGPGLRVPGVGEPQALRHLHRPGGGASGLHRPPGGALPQGPRLSALRRRCWFPRPRTPSRR